MAIVDWLFGKIRNVAVDAQADEMQRFLASLRGMDDLELAMLLLWVTHFRHRLAEGGIDLMDPILLTSTHPKMTADLSRTVRDFQLDGRTADAAALMVWLHTLRGATSPELRFQARQIWRELMRGAWKVPDAYSAVTALFAADQTTTLPRTDGYCHTPIGFEPPEDRPDR